MIKTIEDAEQAVKTIFDQEFPNKKYNEWNLNMNDATARHIINSVGKASRINVKNFIEDLWK